MNLGDRLWLVSFLCVIRSNAFGLDFFSFLVHFLLFAKEVDFIILFGGGRRRRVLCGSSLSECLPCGTTAGQRVEFRAVRCDVRVPPGYMWVGGRDWGSDCFVDVHISLGRRVSKNSVGVNTQFIFKK